jgi:hypothetical protein
LAFFPPFALTVNYLALIFYRKPKMAIDATDMEVKESLNSNIRIVNYTKKIESREILMWIMSALPTDGEKK